MTSTIDWKELREDMKKALAPIEEKYNIAFKQSNISYDNTSFRFPLEGVYIKDGKSPEQILFEKNCARFNIPPELYGKEFSLQGEKYRVSGINPKARKYPVEILHLRNGIKKKMQSEDLLRIVE